MQQQTGRITRNTFYYTNALVIQKLISFFYFTFLARVIGVSELGKYIFALSFTTIFSVFIDLGLSPLLTREIAKDKNNSTEYFNNILALKIPLAIFIYFLAIFVVKILNYPLITRQLVYISGLSMVLDSFTLTFWSVLRGRHNLKYESIASIIFQIIVAVIGSFVLFSTKNLHFLMLSLLVASLFTFLLSLGLIYKKLNISLKLKFNKNIIFLFKMALPFALAGIFNRFYSYIDSILLSFLAGDKAVGWYGVGFKLISALQFIPMAFAASIYPAMSSYYVTSREYLAKTFEKSSFYLMLIALPISLGIIILADKIILIFYGQEYFESILPLQLLQAALIFVFLNFPVGSLLNACNRQLINTINIGLAMIFNIILNIILIPKFLYFGAAITYLLSAILLYILGLYQVRKIIFFNWSFLIINFLKSLLASLVMAIFLIYFKNINIFLYFLLIPLGGVIYFTIMILTRGFNFKELFKIYKILKTTKY